LILSTRPQGAYDEAQCKAWDAGARYTNGECFMLIPNLKHRSSVKIYDKNVIAHAAIGMLNDNSNGTSPYGIDTTDLYTVSDACQYFDPAYTEPASFDITIPDADAERFPRCFYSLPVIRARNMPCAVMWG